VGKEPPTNEQAQEGRNDDGHLGGTWGALGGDEVTAWKFISAEPKTLQRLAFVCASFSFVVLQTVYILLQRLQFALQHYQTLIRILPNPSGAINQRAATRPPFPPLCLVRKVNIPLESTCLWQKSVSVLFYLLASVYLLFAVGKWFFGDTSKESIIEIPDGQLYIVRPLSLKGYSELIYKDAKATIRRTGVDFQYQLVITRVFEEGEEELLDEDGDDAGLSELDKDEQTFLLDEALQFRVDIRDTGEKVFAWRDLSGATSDLWEFVCTTSTLPETVEAFELVAVRCQYERKFKKQFFFTEEPIPTASPEIQPTTSTSPTIPSSPITAKDQLQHEAKASPATKSSGNSAMPAPISHPEGQETYTRERAELHFFDIETGTFVIKDKIVEAVVMDLGGWNYWLKVTGNEGNWIGRQIEDDINPVFNFEYLSAIFNVYGQDHSAYSWLLRFGDREQLERFQQGLMQSLWEHNNQVKWAKLKQNDQDYVMEAFNDLTMEDEEDDVLEPVEEESSDDEDRPGLRTEDYDSDESQEDVETQPKDGNVNSQLAVGQRHDRAFVVRGSKIGVFKHNADNNLEFVTNIAKVATPKGKMFSPTKVMLHAGDANMILQHADDPNSVYRMDLETGKVVDEWKVHDDITINTFAPETVRFVKYSLSEYRANSSIEIRPNDGSTDVLGPFQECHVPCRS